MVGRFSRDDPRIDFGSAKLPKHGYLVRRHFFALDPFVNSVTFDSEMDREFLDGKPSFINERFHFDSSTSKDTFSASFRSLVPVIIEAFDLHLERSC